MMMMMMIKLVKEDNETKPEGMVWPKKKSPKPWRLREEAVYNVAAEKKRTESNVEAETGNIGNRIDELEAKKMRFWIAFSFICMVVVSHSLPSSRFLILTYDDSFTDLFPAHFGLHKWASPSCGHTCTEHMASCSPVHLGFWDGN